MSFLTDNESVFRFLHILAGITWIGMLYFFNLVNLPLLKFQLKKPYEANMAEKATGPIVVKTLFWFRWGSFFTVLLGLILVGVKAEQYKALGGLHYYFLETNMMGYSILLGILLALVMAFNVWFIIWPRQQKILANNKRMAEPTIPEEEKARLTAENGPMVKTATLASRTNTWLSIPMLWGMVMGAHGYSGTGTLSEWRFPVVLLLVVLAFMWLYSSQKPKKTA